MAPPPPLPPMGKPPMPRNPSRSRNGAGPSPPHAGNLQSDPSMYPSAGAAMQGFGSTRQYGSTNSRHDMMSVPDDLTKPQKTGFMSKFRSVSYTHLTLPTKA